MTISNISSDWLQNSESQSFYQSAPSAQNSTQSGTVGYASTDTSQPVQDSVQLSAAGMMALQSPEEILVAADAGDPTAIAIIQKDQKPV